ncbi:adaptin carboxy-terminal domain protein (macronuclear) [Tetrahymena thermophila SB210]|uniref:Adaptin carboxy-terminal domain protein n=1 Tax=Tetrahymena thermophila (strain SB210) TaxID=312017 RepID=I7M2W7_TETTS|nr:adaptin carboxy-terminal domain protein [Tetrahymena thermophila SB210]EAS01441.2 adaptin carboxy-terminal domain protein [Tetrahymena thermophila SB210]|eukprot:XP_001021687.2 adaptin carboxy-terminal domain protein [Tetrahymena thermophila SB210]
MSQVNTSKEYYLEVLRSKTLFRKKQAEIIQSLKVELNQSQEVYKLKEEIAKNLTLACSEILSSNKEEGIYKLSCILIIKDIMDLGQQSVLIYVSQNLLNLIKTTVINFSNTDPVGIYYISESPSEKDQQIGEAIVGRMLECIFTWACWHFRNSNGTKTRYFLALESCLREGTEFPEEEKFIYFQREEIFRFQGKAGFQAVLYLEDLVDLQFQISETKIFLHQQFDLSEAQTDQAKLQDCLAYYEEILADQKQKQLEHFFPDDKIIYESEMWYVEKVVPKFHSYKSKKITFQEFKINVQDIINKHEDYKKKAIQQKPNQQNQSSVTNRSQQDSISGQATQKSSEAQAVQKQNQQSNRTVEQSSGKMPPENVDQQKQQTRATQQSIGQQMQSKNQGAQQTDEQQQSSMRKNSVEKRNDGGQKQPSQSQLDNQQKQNIDELKQEQQLFLRKILELENKIKEKDDSIKKFEDIMLKSEQELKQLKLSKKQQEETIENLEEQLQEYRLSEMSQKNQNSQKSNEETLRLQQKLNEQIEEKDKLKQKITFLQSELEESQKDRAFLQSKKDEKEQEVDSLNNRIEELQNQVEDLNQNLHLQQQKIYEIQEEKENEVRVERFNLEQENDRLKGLISELELKIQSLSHEKDFNYQDLQVNQNLLEESIKQLRAENEEQKNFISQLQQIAADEEQKTVKWQQDYDILLAEHQNLKEDLNTARANQNKIKQEDYNFQILENQIKNLTERNKELEHLLEQAELNAAAAPSQLSNQDYHDRSSYQQRVQEYDNKINQLQEENHNIPILQTKINELETLINQQQKSNPVKSADQEMRYSQIKKVLAETIEKSKQLDTQLNTFIQQKHSVSQQQAFAAQRSSSAQNFRVPQQNQHKDYESSREEYNNQFASTQQLRRPDLLNRSYRGAEQENDLKHYMTQPNFYNPNRSNNESQKLRLSQLNSMKYNKLSGMASTNGFSNMKNSFNKKVEQIFVDESLALPEKYEDEEAQLNQSVNSLNDIRDLRQIDRIRADLIFPFRNPKTYYSNKARLKSQKGKLVQYDANLFSYIRFSQETLYKFKRSNLKWKFSIFENEDLQIGQISSSDVINNQYIVKLGLYFTNKTDNDISNLSITYLHSNKILMQKDQQILMAQLTSKKQIKQSLTLSYTQIPYEVVLADVEYRCHGFNQKFQVPIPCLLTKYIEIQELQNEAQFKNLWKEISKFNLITSEDCSINRSIAKSPQDFHNYFPHFLNLNPEKASQFHLGLNDYILGGQIYLREPNVTFMLKIYLKPNNMISFKISSGSEFEDRNVVEFFLQNLLFLFTIQ